MSATAQAADAVVTKLNRAAGFYALAPTDVVARMGDCEALPPKLRLARAQKAALLQLRDQLKRQPAQAHRFPQRTGVGWMDKLLAGARLRELAAVRIVKAGKSSGLRYNIKELGGTWYGRRVLDSLGFSKRRTSVDKEEYAKIAASFERINLTLPQTIEPTTTERFFLGELD